MDYYCGTEVPKIIEEIKAHGIGYFITLDYSLQTVREISLALVSSHHRGIKYVPERFKNDFDFVLEATNHFKQTFQYASDELKNNHSLLMLIIPKDPEAFEWASNNLQNNRQLIELFIEHISQEYKSWYFYKECVEKLKIFQENDWLDKNVPVHQVKPKSNKF